MAKPTLLEIVQDILTEISGDQVNSISDTQEATDVATIVRIVFNEMIDELELPPHKELKALEGLGNLSKPNYMRVPEAVSLVEWIKYDTRQSLTANKEYTTIQYLTPYEFVDFCNARPDTDTTNYVVVQDSANIPLTIGRLDAPAYWTSFDDEYVVFDSFDSDVDATLQSSKSLCSVVTRPVFTLSDDAVPDLPENLFNVLRVHALNRVYADLRQTVNPKTERVESRFRVRSQRNKQRSRRIHDDWPDYGRKPRG
jgi:hypothetical protein